MLALRPFSLLFYCKKLYINKTKLIRINYFISLHLEATYVAFVLPPLGREEGLRLTLLRLQNGNLLLHAEHFLIFGTFGEFNELLHLVHIYQGERFQILYLIIQCEPFMCFCVS